MTRRILKWNVEINDNEQSIGGGPVVHVDWQQPPDGYVALRHLIQVWTLESETSPAPKRTVRVVGTGHDIPYGFEPIGTALMHGGELVWHVAERRDHGA